jgi:hypothetical protein
VAILVAAVSQLTGTVNQTGIGIEIEIVSPDGEIVSTLVLGPDVGWNLLYVIQHGTQKIQVGSVSVLKPGVSKVA